MRGCAAMTIALIVLGFLCVSNLLLAGDGQALFDSMKCGSCHKPDRKGAGVSLKEITKVYQDPAHLVSYFKGEGPMRIESTRANMMQGPLKNLKALPDEDKEAMSDYILSFK
ncbi:MAG TPA: c-type cytochrome [Syntrophobacteraceae bacterium]|nr:c-type cytochrome [Syntrophobacteraceae bacterium]